MTPCREKVFAMSKATRILAVTGMALMAGLTLGAAPAMASSSTSTTTTTAEQSSPQADRSEGYYRSRRDCERAGRWGERRGRWDDYDCDYVWRGRRHGWWELNVDYGWGGGGDHDGGGGGGHDWPRTLILA